MRGFVAQNCINQTDEFKCPALCRGKNERARNADTNHSGMVSTKRPIYDCHVIAAVRAQPFSHSRADRHDNAQAHFASLAFGVARKTCKLKMCAGRTNTRLSHSSMAQTARCRKLCHQHLERTHTTTMQPNVPLKIITESLISSSLMQTEVDNNVFNTIFSLQLTKQHFGRTETRTKIMRIKN